MTFPSPLLLMTRPKAASEAFLARLMARDVAFEPVVSPLLDIVPLPVVPLGEARGLVFTSANGVRAWMVANGALLPSFAVGDATARVARAAGLSVRSAAGDAEALVAMIAALRPEAPLLHVRGVQARGDVAQRLTAAGIETRELVAYDQQRRPLSPEAQGVLSGTRPVVAPLFSPRTADFFAQTPVKAPIFVAAMSEAVAKPLRSRHSSRLNVSAHPGTVAMLDCVERLLGEASLLEARGGGG